MATNVINPQDLTGRVKAEREAEVAQEKKEAAKRMSMVTAAADVEKKGTVDLTSPPEDAEGDGPDAAPVSVAKPSKTLRVNTDLEMVTIGHGNTYNFERGQKYKVDADVYNYLDERGFVWH